MDSPPQTLTAGRAESPPPAERALPAGTVTFLFTDIEGSTQRWEHHPAAMALALKRHDALLRTAFEARGGRVFKTVGDALQVAFLDPVAAVLAAADGQRALAAEPWSGCGDGFADLKVRMALHAAPASPEDGGDYRTPVLNRVARLESVTRGGQVLVTLAVHQLVRDLLPPAVGLRDLGERRLKDLRHSEQVFQVVAEGMPDVVTAPETVADLHPRDRILVGEAAAARSLSEAMAMLLDVVRDGQRTVSLSVEQLREVSRCRPADWTQYRLARVAQWSQPQFRLDGRFVELALLIDQGEETTSGRWRAREERYEDLLALVDRVPDPALVVLGPPGSGKSTLLRRLELDVALAALRGEREGGRVTFYVELNHFKRPQPGAPLPAPGAWLAELWALRYPDLPDLGSLLRDGRVTFLLDALNEMPVADDAEFHEAIRLWKDFVHSAVHAAPTNRLIFSCRSLDYSAPLSTHELRVPQVRIEPMGDDQVRRFLRLYSPLYRREIWEELEGSPQLELLRSPYFLKLLVEQVEEIGAIPRGRAALFTGFVRQALRREIERDNPLFVPGRLLTSRDCRRIAQWSWRTPWELPGNGILIPKLYALAYEMQAGGHGGKASQLRLSYDEALDLLADERDADILRAGMALSVLDEDTASDEVLYIHQLVQEYFAAQRLAAAPDGVADLVRAPWRAADVRPTLEQTMAMIATADPLPPLPSSGWDQTAILAAAISPDPDTFVSRVMDVNLALAGQCAGQPDVRLGEPLQTRLSQALATRSRDPEADLRARIDAALALGRLGDPRFERCAGPDGAYLAPPMVEVPAGTYPIGRDGATPDDESPRHTLALPAFRLGRFPVTNAEWSCFMAAGGYDDVRWWDTEAARAWQRGDGTAEGIRNGSRFWRRRYLAEPDLLERIHASGGMNDERYAQWRRSLELDDDDFEAMLARDYPGGRMTEPRFWRDDTFNHPLLPVVGVSWFEARAYGNWLAAQSGRPFRLPSEAEWEAAARGPSGHRYAFGDAGPAMCCNTVEAHLRRTSPIGVFPEGDTPTGLADMTGNVWEWTSSLFGRRQDGAEFKYPYRPDDGREDAHADSGVIRVARGGSWYYDLEASQATTRYTYYPDGRNVNVGFRLAC